MQMGLDENDHQTDLSVSSVNRSVHLPVEKQRGMSEIIRKRNSRFKVEDYKRAFQRSSTFDEVDCEQHRPLSSSKSDQTLAKNFAEDSLVSSLVTESPKSTRRLTKTKSFEIPIEIENEQEQRKQMSIEKLNDLINKPSEDHAME